MDNQNIVQQNNTDTSLLDRLKLIDHIVGIATALNTECTNLQLEAESERKKAVDAKNGRIWAPLLTLLLFWPAAPVVALILWLPKNGPKAHLKKAEEIEIQLKKKTSEANKYIQQNIDTLKLIPNKYWYPLATNYLVELIETGRADTLSTAFDKLEVQIHYWNMENSMKDQLKIQQTQADLLVGIAIATTVSAFSDIDI